MEREASSVASSRVRFAGVDCGGGHASGHSRVLSKCALERGQGMERVWYLDYGRRGRYRGGARSWGGSRPARVAA
eukprot:scaffold61914_cov49-Phaeocystis_antarctica.AAC.3